MDWFSEQAVQRFRHIVLGFKRFHGLSNSKLALLLGDRRIGPSASTLARFLDTCDAGSELSLRHVRQVHTSLRVYLSDHGQIAETRAFIESCREDLQFFELCEGSSRDISLDETPAKGPAKQATGLRGKFIIARRVRSQEFIFSLAIFSDLQPFGCHVHKLSCEDAPISMTCRAFSINSMIYVEGVNPIHDTLRFMCCSKFGPDLDVLSGVIAGFESLGIPFASRMIVAKISTETDPNPELDQLIELNTFQQAETFLVDMALAPKQAVAALKTCASAGYLPGGSMQI